MRQRKLAALAMLALLLVVAAAWYFFEQRDPAGLIQLDETLLANLRDEFNRAADSARVIVLLSPT